MGTRNASILLDEKKKPIGAQAIVRNITENKFNTELIQEQKKELDIIIDNASLGIVLAEEGKIIKTNNTI